MDPLQTIDARVWAKEFCSRFGNETVDEALMITWFANAIMRGYDAAEAKWRPVVELAKAVVEDGELTDLATGRCPVSEHLLIDLEKALRDAEGGE